LKRVYLATSNAGKVHDFAGAAAVHGVTLAALPGFAQLAPVPEDGDSFEANARKKAEAYSRSAPDALVLADDSGLEVDALAGAPGVASALYAAREADPTATRNSSDAENSARLLRELAAVGDAQRTARFVCVLAAARDGQTLATFRGEAEGRILTAPRGTRGFGYDPLFYLERLKKNFAELVPEEKAAVSHRGRAFARFLDWFRHQPADG
jgi:XTP/dITP diphosphohydrolase